MLLDFITYKNPKLFWTILEILCKLCGIVRMIYNHAESAVILENTNGTNW